MRKNISIDELFREGLSEGREQLNLGAWANMERMLDGKSPYSSDNEEKEKKKRRILPLFWLLLVALIGATGAFFMKNKGDKKEHHGYTASATTQSSTNSTSTNSTEDQRSDQSSTSTETKGSQNQIQGQTRVEIDPETTSPSTDHHSTRKHHLSEQQVTTTSTSTSHDSDPSHTNHSITATTSNNTNLSNTEVTSASTVPSNVKRNKRVKTYTDRASASANNTQENKEASNADLTITSSTPVQGATLLNDTVEQITRVERVTGTLNGKPNRSLDTINQSQQIVVKEETRQPIDYHQSNPRYVDLNHDQINQASHKEELKTIPVTGSEPKTTGDVAKTETKNHRESEQAKWKESLETGRIKLGNALHQVSIRKILAYPGITAGVNAALFTSSHNYGGFHAGVSNLTPINDHLSFLSEIKFYYRSNSGYSVQDIQSSMKGFTADTTTLYNQNQTIYTYYMDSSVRRYNFKHMYSVEMPLSLQYHLNRLSFYGGINLAYNTRLNTTMVTTNTVAPRVDTVDKNFAFMAPSSSNYKYVGDDFKSRFGVGYMFGASYSFSPKLYIDLRATQTQWDNSKTVTSRNISSGVFKIPYIQFSLGYRFKDFTPRDR